MSRQEGGEWLKEQIQKRKPRVWASGENRHIHCGDEVDVGKYSIWAGGLAFLREGDLDGYDLIIPMDDGRMSLTFGRRYNIFCAYVDGNWRPVEYYWPAFIDEVAKELKAGKKILAYCFAGHGRTGTLIASLIAILESKEETPDPILAVRARYCEKAVEDEPGARLIFSLRNESIPEIYKEHRLLDADDRF